MSDREYEMVDEEKTEEKVEEPKSVKKRGRKKTRTKKDEEPEPAPAPAAVADPEPDATESVKSGHVAHEEDPEERVGDQSYSSGVGDTGGDGGGGGGGGSGASGGAAYIPKKTHILMISFFATTLFCLLAIVPSRSLGIGKYQEGSAGAWSHCYTYKGVETCGGDMDNFGERTASGVFGIFCILLVTAMLALQVFEFLKPGKLKFFLKLICILHHVLWLFLLISWALWASFTHKWNDSMDSLREKNPSEQYPGHLYYAWGFVFLIFMWIAHIFLAALWTIKVMGKNLFGF